MAPHPDDEALLASGLILRAKQSGERVVVIVMTNGDFNCQADGLTREPSPLKALLHSVWTKTTSTSSAILTGTWPEWVKFLLLPVQRRIDGKCCTRATTPTARRGHGRREFHRSRFGAHAVYTAEQAVGDFGAFARPTATSTGSGNPPQRYSPGPRRDLHLRAARALGRLNHEPEVLRGLVHNGDCWPTGEDANGHCLPGRIAPHENVPPLSGVLSGHVPDVRLAAAFLVFIYCLRRKPEMRAIGAHHSQTHDDPASYLFSFARAEEVFFRAPRTEATERTVLVRARITSSHQRKTIQKRENRSPRTATHTRSRSIASHSRSPCGTRAQRAHYSCTAGPCRKIAYRAPAGTWTWCSNAYPSVAIPNSKCLLTTCSSA